MINEILLFFSWPIFIIISFQLVKIALKKLNKTKIES
jgi:hypothetical protein